MKVSEFIKRFSDYPDFDLSVCMSYADDSDWGATFTKSDIVGLTDIGHSDKVIVLDIDFSYAENFIASLVQENKQLRQQLNTKSDNNALTIEEKRWIPVSEKMPDYTDNYNVVCNVGNMLGGYTDVRTYRFECIKGGKKKWCIPDRFDEVVQVTHWQPLPKP